MGLGFRGGGGDGLVAPESLVFELPQEVLLTILPLAIHQSQRRNLHLGAIVSAACSGTAAFQLADAPLSSSQVILQLLDLALMRIQSAVNWDKHSHTRHLQAVAIALVQRFSQAVIQQPALARLAVAAQFLLAFDGSREPLLFFLPCVFHGGLHDAVPAWGLGFKI